jgi:hypothetical protein
VLTQHQRQRAGADRSEEVKPQQAIHARVREWHNGQPERWHGQLADAQAAHGQGANGAEPARRSHVEIATEWETESAGAGLAEGGRAGPGIHDKSHRGALGNLGARDQHPSGRLDRHDDGR